jgi:glycosyltransferase involved in cell wall biosynthesis
VLGFRGHEIFWPIRWIARDKPLIIDALMSPSAALAEESKAGVIGRMIAPLLRRMELGILRHADLVLTDTNLHASYYEMQFGLPRDKILTLPVGAAEPAQEPAPRASKPLGSTGCTTFNVLFFGSMLPLHGIDTIVEAAARLRDLPIRFDFVGGNTRQVRRLTKLCADLDVTRYTHRRWVPLHELIAHDIPQADLCLGGPFGGTPQASRVITGKTSQCLALGKATVIGRIGEDIGLQDKVNCLLVPQADADALAEAIQWGFVHREALAGIGANGRTLYQLTLSVITIATRLVPAIEQLCAARADAV